MGNGISQGGISSLKQILYIRDYLDYDTFLFEGDKNKNVPPPLSPQIVKLIKSSKTGWTQAVRELISQFNSNPQDVKTIAALFGIQVNSENPQIKAYQLSEAKLKDLSGSDDLKKALKIVDASNISAKDKAVLRQLLYIRDYLDYDTFILEGNKAKGISSPLSPETISNIRHPNIGWTLTLRDLVANFNLDATNVKAAAALFNIPIDPNNPQVKAYQFSEAKNGLNIKDDSTDLKAVLCKIDRKECGVTSQKSPAEKIYTPPSPPNVKVTSKAILVRKPKGTSNNSLLDEVAYYIKQIPDTKMIKIGVHTDNRGNAENNQHKSQRIAEEISQELMNRGVPASKLEAKGYGQTKPIVPNITAFQRARNRRIEFKIIDRKVDMAKTEKEKLPSEAIPDVPRPQLPRERDKEAIEKRIQFFLENSMRRYFAKNESAFGVAPFSMSLNILPDGSVKVKYLKILKKATKKELIELLAKKKLPNKYDCYSEGRENVKPIKPAVITKMMKSFIEEKMKFEPVSGSAQEFRIEQSVLIIR